MHYAVVHIRKYTHSKVRALEKHNQRTWNSSSRTIDSERSAKNFNAENGCSVDSGFDLVGAVDDKISKALKGRKLRSNAVVLCEAVVTSDKAFFESMSEAEIKKFFKVAYEKLAKRYGKENIVSAIVHMDETTPHMHLDFVPLVEKVHKTKTKEELQTCLSAKTVLDREALRTLQEQFPKELAAEGYDLVRGIPNDDNYKVKHKPSKEFNKEQLKKVDTRLADRIIDSAVVADVSGFFEKRDDRLCFPVSYGDTVLNCIKYIPNSILEVKKQTARADRLDLRCKVLAEEKERLEAYKNGYNELVKALGGESKAKEVITAYNEQKAEKERLIKEAEERRKVEREREQRRKEYEAQTKGLIMLGNNQHRTRKPRKKSRDDNYIGS